MEKTKELSASVAAKIAECKRLTKWEMIREIERANPGRYVLSENYMTWDSIFQVFKKEFKNHLKRRENEND